MSQEKFDANETTKWYKIKYCEQLVIDSYNKLSKLNTMASDNVPDLKEAIETCLKSYGGYFNKVEQEYLNYFPQNAQLSKLYNESKSSLESLKRLDFTETKRKIDTSLSIGNKLKQCIVIAAKLRRGVMI